MDLQRLKTIAAPLCSEFDVARLEAFGSVARGGATETSDVDLLVAFREPDRAPARRFFGLLHGLEDVLGCSVDLLTADSLHNPYFRNRVRREKVAVYEA